jgi:hypothetical protein
VLLTLLINVFTILLYRNGGWHHDSAPIYLLNTKRRLA